MAGRIFACVGDPTTTAGVILPPGGPLLTVRGPIIALIGDMATCPACTGVGVIRKVGNERRVLINGREMALINDEVICGCPVHPKLIPPSRGCTHS
jgi:uncharacterized Zn-binding protein involved in type VI secretion